MHSVLQISKISEPESPTRNALPISIEQYDELEGAAVQRYAPYVARQFQSQTFQELPFQMHMKSASELWKFIDSQHEIRFEENMIKFLSKRLTAQEYELFTYLTKKTVEYCKSHSFEPISGRNAISRALIAIRAITQLVPPGATVLEVGPGSGYVSAGLVKLGYKVISYDVTQSLFLHQSSFWNFLFGERYACCADPNSKVDLANRDLCHIPWWNFANTNFEIPAIDVLTVNHALNEMPSLSVRFILYRVKHANIGRSYKVIIEGIGYDSNDNYREIVEPNFRVLHYNNEMIHREFVPVIVLESAANDSLPEAPLQQGINARILNYAKKKLANDEWPWRALYNFYLSHPRFFRIPLRIVRKGVRGIRKLIGSDFEIRYPTTLLEQLKHTSFAFRFNYADIQDFFDDALPEGNNLTQFEKFSKLIGTTHHM